ncbi:MAG: hypothetical protein QS99_C0016G0047 [archaeon GW2011_AR4]|nr:MAG: hypothetical protein QS99_C0016G0047 [archaeon GW2011_AR4]HIJ04121.1 hypothetical protein [Candidatus Woesearchaeota archaeon]
MKQRHALFFLVIFLLVFIIAEYNLFRIDFIGDEARHAVQGQFCARYINSFIHGDLVSYGGFLKDFSTWTNSISWYALYDPPGHAFLQGFLFLLFGESVFTARLLTYLFVVVGGVLLFFFSQRIFNDNLKALITVMVFFLFPPIFFFRGQNYLAIPIAVLTIGFFYAFLYADAREKLEFYSRVMGVFH